MKNRSEMSTEEILEELSFAGMGDYMKQFVPDFDHTIEVPIIPYTIEEALEDLKSGEVENVQYTHKNKKYLLRYNEERNLFEYSNFKSIYWNVCEYSYLRMKTWEDIGIHEEEYEKNRDIILSALGGLDLRKLKEELEILEIDCLFKNDSNNHIFYFFIKKAKDEEKIRKYILPNFFTSFDQCKIVHIDDVINNL